MGDGPKPNPVRTHPLTARPGLSEAAVGVLSKHWINTAEAVLALAALAQGREGLKKILSIDDAQLRAMIELLKGEIGPSAAAASPPSTPGGELGLALTPEQRRKIGIQSKVE